MTRSQLNIVGLIGVLLLGCILTYPFGADQALYGVGGDIVMRKGGLLYKDFLEPKGPIIYYLYGFSLWIFGHHVWSPRLLDILYQIISLVFFYNILYEIFNSRTEAALSVLIYIILYVSAGYSETTEPESFALLPSLIILKTLIYFEKKEIHSPMDYLFSGIFIALGTIVSFLTKYTLIAPFLASIFFLMMYSQLSFKKRFNLIVSITLWVSLFSTAYFYYLYKTDSWNNFILMLEYLRKYSEIHPLLSLDTIRTYYYQDFPAAIVKTFTPAIIGLAAIGIGEIVRLKRRHEVHSDRKGILSIFFTIIILQLCFGLGGVLYERKFFIYHFERIYWCVAPLAALGIVYITRFFHIYNKRKNIFRVSFGKKLLFTFLVSVILFYSPLGRLGYHPLRWSWLALTKNDTAQYAIQKYDGYDVESMMHVSNYISTRSHPDDEVFLWVYSVEIYFLLNKVPPTICLANLHLIAPWTPLDWKKEVLEQLKRSPPRFFVSEQNDAQSFISGTNLDSYSSLLQWEDLKTFLFDHYRLEDSTEHFKIYSRSR